MEFKNTLPTYGWLKRCSIGCSRPTANQLVVFIIKKKFYDSYICSCCNECFKKKIQVHKKKHFTILYKVKYSAHVNTMLIKLL